eukprot:6470176-Amphidinium_carterae.2
MCKWISAGQLDPAGQSNPCHKALSRNVLVCARIMSEQLRVSTVCELFSTCSQCGMRNTQVCAEASILPSQRVTSSWPMAIIFTLSITDFCSRLSFDRHQLNDSWLG